MSDLNVCCFSGRLTRDANLRYTGGGTPVSDISIACSEVFTKDGNKQENVLFLDCALFGKSAESLDSYLKKGTFVTVTGKLKLESWTDKEGKKHSKHSLVVNQLNLGPKGGNGNSVKVEEAEEGFEDIPL